MATQNRFNAAVHFHLWASVTRISSLTKQSNAYLMGANFVLMRLLQRRRAARTFNVHLYHTGAIIEHNVSSRVVVLVVPHATPLQHCDRAGARDSGFRQQEKKTPKLAVQLCELCKRSSAMAQTKLFLALIVVAACGLTAAQNTFGTSYGDTGNGDSCPPPPEHVNHVWDHCRGPRWRPFWGCPALFRKGQRASAQTRHRGHPCADQPCACRCPVCAVAFAARGTEAGWHSDHHPGGLRTVLWVSLCGNFVCKDLLATLA